MNNYVVYHLHDDTSNVNGFADSCTKFDEYIKLAKKCNMKAIAFSNHGGIYDWIKKKQYCDKYGIKYIHGVELYLCVNLEDNTRGYHIGLYAKNWDGVKELNRLMSIATSKGVKEDNTDRHYYFNPRISFEELMNTSDNIIITTACLASPLWKLSDKSIATENKELYYNNIKRRDELLKWLSENKHRCFLEIQYHNCEHQKEFNNMIIKWHKEYDIPIIAGTDTHSLNEYKSKCRKILQKSKNSFYGEEDEFDLTWKTYDELVEAFELQNSVDKSYYLEAINNTNKLANMVEEFSLDKTFKYPTLYGKNARKQWKDTIYKMFNDKCKRGVIDKSKIDIYKEQIKEEFKVMSKLGMESFMLFMSELMVWCKKNNINSSPCRGSVGGSTIAFITDIISVDPIKWNTVFSRFCNADRISLGDIDEDFAPQDREKVYQYIIDRFGNKNVSYILTLGTIKDRGSIDVLAKGLDYKDLNSVKDIKNSFDEYFSEFKKIIMEEVNIEELEGATSSSPTFDDVELYKKVISKKNKATRIVELKKLWDKLREDNKELFYYFDGIKGTIISKGNHPSGMIGSPITLFDNLGVYYKDGDENTPISTCSMKAVDSLNFVKFDILGLKTIGILQDTYKLLNKRWEEPYEINWDDDNVWDDMITCNAGIFQFEGDYAHDLLKKFKPRAINDMSLVNASLRPSGKSYRDRLINHEFNKNPSKEIDNLLKDNKGFLVFQEDTIKFLTDICGFSGSLADTTRRAIGKKDVELLNEQLPKILEGYCSKSSNPRSEAEKEAREFIQIISDSSEYQFGYNHSTGYSMNGYMCARMRYYYPLEFTTAYLNNAENDDDIANGLLIAKTKGIGINNIKFRYSKAEYMCDKETNTIYKGIKSIKYLNKQCAEELYELKDNKYNTFTELLYDIAEKVKINSKQMKILILLDFFDEFGKSGRLLKTYNLFSTFYGKKQLAVKKIEELKLDKEIVESCSSVVTAKTFREINFKKFFEIYESKFANKDVPIKIKLKAEIDFLGDIVTVMPELKSDLYFVTDIEEYKNKKSITYYPTIYNIRTGETIKYKLKNFLYFAENPIKQYDMINITKQLKEGKRKLVDGHWTISKDEFWNIIEAWEIY